MSQEPTNEFDDFGWYPDNQRYVKTFESFVQELNEKDPCWKGYEMIGMKKKGKRQVPNCVPESNNLDEGAMGELDLLAQESKNLADFKKKAIAEFPQIKTMEGYEEWLSMIFDEAK